jgi:hypothetical protein
VALRSTTADAAGGPTTTSSSPPPSFDQAPVGHHVALCVASCGLACCAIEAAGVCAAHPDVPERATHARSSTAPGPDGRKPSLSIKEGASGGGSGPVRASPSTVNQERRADGLPVAQSRLGDRTNDGSMSSARSRTHSRRVATDLSHIVDRDCYVAAVAGHRWRRRGVSTDRPLR